MKAKKPAARNGKIERNIEVRSDGYSFRVRMKIGEAFINETFFSLEEARAYRDLLRAGKSTDRDQEKVLRAKAEKKASVALTVKVLLNRYLLEVTSKKKGWREEGYAIAKLVRHTNFSNLPIYLADGDAVHRLEKEFRAATPPMSDTTIRKYMMLISHLFNVAVSRRWCKDLLNPIKTVELPRPPKMRQRRFELEEYAYLSAELQNAVNPEIWYFFECLIETACRRGELLRLRFKDVNLDDQTATLIDTKNGEDRTIGLSLKAVTLLRAIFEAQVPSNPRIASSECAVFRLKPAVIRNAFLKAKRNAREKYEADCVRSRRSPSQSFLHDIRLHDCRREATSRMFEKGLDVMDVSAMTGHKTLSMLRGYTNLRARDLARKLG